MSLMSWLVRLSVLIDVVAQSSHDVHHVGCLVLWVATLTAPRFVFVGNARTVWVNHQAAVVLPALELVDNRCQSVAYLDACIQPHNDVALGILEGMEAHVVAFLPHVQSVISMRPDYGPCLTLGHHVVGHENVFRVGVFASNLADGLAASEVVCEDGVSLHFHKSL